MGSFDPSRIKLPSQRTTHSATSRSVDAAAAIEKKRKATMSWRISCYSTGTRVRLKKPPCCMRSFVSKRTILLVLAGGALWGQSGDFRTTLFPILEMANCRACHNPDGVASATRLHFPEADADADKIAAFGNSLVVLVDGQNLEASLLLRKPTARMPHTGGERIKQNSPEETVLKAWIAKLAQLSGA